MNIIQFFPKRIRKFLGLDDTFAAYVAGRVLFEAAAGVEHDADLFWDNVNKRLGIGTTSPDYRLHLESGADAHNTFKFGSSEGYFNQILARGLGALNNYRDFSIGANNFQVQTASADGATTVTTRFFIENTTGNVGIGTTSPKSKLHVIGLPVYANNAAAVAGGLTAGAFYRTNADPDPVCVVH